MRLTNTKRHWKTILMNYFALYGAMMSGRPMDVSSIIKMLEQG